MRGGLSTAAFSLTEVVLALGIIAFALMSILGLFSVGMSASRRSGEDTVLSAMATEIASTLRAGTAPYTASNYLFDHDGRVVMNASEAIYACQLSLRQPSAAEVPNVGTNLVMATFLFTWPATLVESKRPNSNTIYATLPAR